MPFDNFNHNRYVITFIFSTINEIEIPKLKLFFEKHYFYSMLQTCLLLLS